jgi:hypothetical protein
MTRSETSAIKKKATSRPPLSVVDARVKPGHDDSLTAQLHPVVLPHVSHFMQVPFLTSVKFPHSPHISPS